MAIKPAITPTPGFLLQPERTVQRGPKWRDSEGSRGQAWDPSARQVAREEDKSKPGSHACMCVRVPAYKHLAQGSLHWHFLMRSK